MKRNNEKIIRILSKRNEELESKIIELSNEIENDKNIKEEYKDKMSILLNKFESMHIDFKETIDRIYEKENEIDDLIKTLKRIIKDTKYVKYYNIFRKRGD